MILLCCMKLLYPYEIKVKTPIKDKANKTIGYKHEYSIEDEEFSYYFRPVFINEIFLN